MSLSLDEIIRQRVDDRIEEITPAVVRKILEDRPKPEYSGPRWLTAKEFCKQYNMCRTTLWRMGKSGRVEVLNGGGRFVRFRWKEGNKSEWESLGEE